MKEHLVLLISLAAMTAGVLCLLGYLIAVFTAWSVASRYVSVFCIGLVLIAGAGTYMWINGRN